jgi:hypothetical protein
MKEKALGCARIGLVILIGGLVAITSNVARSQVGAQVNFSVGLDIRSPSDFYRSPNSAVPMRTSVAPSSIATSKSPVIPMLR